MQFGKSVYHWEVCWQTSQSVSPFLLFSFIHRHSSSRLENQPHSNCTSLVSTFSHLSSFPYKVMCFVCSFTDSTVDTQTNAWQKNNWLTIDWRERRAAMTNWSHQFSLTQWKKFWRKKLRFFILHGKPQCRASLIYFVWIFFSICFSHSQLITSNFFYLVQLSLHF